ncbi:sulfotransferase family 2 domain-containing protein [Jannaschia pohangensis]|uniref:Sulfotransferase family protein n=1 Tax=Jannaschia pohangensis TaxID=390807 RepID=A0A1I3QV57_9RHOB|nr:sulfotransferase family 2 domain-containing protein [Jannaschia pohangensis]SFJ36987.1 Sulfotransferase family protein [Jannaschia pohangensis]
MEYLPDHRLCFLHIPKNAGKSVRAALSRLGPADHRPLAADLNIPEAEVEDAIQAAWDHPDLGPIHPAHIPLATMRTHFTASWAAFTACRSFCLTRAPRDRFLSALLQRLREFEDAGALTVDDPRVAAEAARVCEWLARQDGPIIEAQYIHFGRQTDFTDLDGGRQVTAIFPMDASAALERWLEEALGLSLTVEKTHVRRQPKAWARGLQPAARFAGRWLMPRAVKKAIYPLWTRSPVFDNARGSYAGVDLGADVEAFIADHYACDAALHAEALSASEARA